MADYAFPDVLVDPGWVAERLNDPGTRVVLADRHMKPGEDPRIPGSVLWLWAEHMQHPAIHDIPDKTMMEGLLGRAGIGNDTAVVLYGAVNNFYAAFAFWLLKIYGHEDVRLMHGGIKRWQAAGHSTTTDAPQIGETAYQAKPPDWSTRALSDDVRNALEDDNRMLVDVRSPPEYAGEVFAPQAPVKFGERAGHIPGAYKFRGKQWRVTRAGLSEFLDRQRNGKGPAGPGVGRGSSANLASWRKLQGQDHAGGKD